MQNYINKINSYYVINGITRKKGKVHAYGVNMCQHERCRDVIVAAALV